MALPDAARAVLQKPLVVRMAVNDPDGYPHVVPVWFGLDGDDMWVTIRVIDSHTDDKRFL